MYWPLIGGLIALVLVSIILGWIMDTSRRDRDADRARRARASALS